MCQECNSDRTTQKKPFLHLGRTFIASGFPRGVICFFHLRQFEMQNAVGPFPTCPGFQSSLVEKLQDALPFCAILDLKAYKLQRLLDLLSVDRLDWENGRFHPFRQLFGRHFARRVVRFMIRLCPRISISRAVRTTICFKRVFFTLTNEPYVRPVYVLDIGFRAVSNSRQGRFGDRRQNVHAVLCQPRSAFFSGQACMPAPRCQVLRDVLTLCCAVAGRKP